MATRIRGEQSPRSIVVSPFVSPSDDVWIKMNETIAEWGIKAGLDLWDRLIARSDELLRTNGLTINFYQQFDSGLPCPCIKSETQQVDQRCPICYGSQFQGGYEKLGFSTIVLASVEPTFVLNNIELRELDHTLGLIDGATSGTILTAPYAVKDSFGYVGLRLDAYDGPVGRSLTHNQVIVEYTIDGGDTFTNLITGNIAPLNQPAFVIQFRITLVRNQPTDPSPSFEVARVRFQMVQDTSLFISKRPFFAQRMLESFGVRINTDTNTWWTTPSIGRADGSVIFIDEDDVVEVLNGFYTNSEGVVEDYPVSGRFKPANVQIIEPRGRFISQRLNLHIIQTDEIENAIF